MLPKNGGPSVEIGRQDLENLLKAALPAVKELLRKHGGFAPIGFSVKPDGSVVAVAGYDADQRLGAREVINLLLQGFRQEAAADTIRAVAICIPVEVTPPGQDAPVKAVQINLEHRGGEAIDAFLPYERGDSGEISFGELFGDRSDPQIFR